MSKDRNVIKRIQDYFYKINTQSLDYIIYMCQLFP